MTSDEMVSHKGALGLILYAITFPSNRETTKWSNELESHYLRCYGKEKLRIIAKSIKYYFDHKDINLNDVVPTDVSVRDKELFLRFILDGLAKCGYID